MYGSKFLKKAHKKDTYEKNLMVSKDSVVGIVSWTELDNILKGDFEDVLKRNLEGHEVHILTSYLPISNFYLSLRASLKKTIQS